MYGTTSFNCLLFFDNMTEINANIKSKDPAPAQGLIFEKSPPPPTGVGSIGQCHWGKNVLTGKRKKRIMNGKYVNATGAKIKP
jgi:hypothetical protein